MTFSIAALCPRTGAFGCAIATSSMAAGARVPFVAPGFGVVLTQARTDPALGALGLRRLEAGRSAAEALSDLLAAAARHAAWRQLAILDRSGDIAHFTGAAVMDPKGARQGQGAIAIGNAVAEAQVIDAILAGFEAAAEEGLPDRLIAALKGGLAAGGEAYPLRSAALKVARPGVPFVPIDLRIDFAETPIAALRHHCQLWSPMVEDYVRRALDPERAPLAEAIEGHARR
ncbi:MAG: DUF1028 domain-containing protein [Alphaproteobacteria bacterium]|nr:DUF1028 domain-containing protein [Alphaproteobacteria bacterium]